MLTTIQNNERFNCASGGGKPHSLKLRCRLVFFLLLIVSFFKYLQKQPTIGSYDIFILAFYHNLFDVD